MLKQAAMFAIALVMVLSAVSFVSAADISGASNVINVGNYTMLENASTGAVNNVSFVNDNLEATIASSINASGSSINALSQYETDNLNLFGNLTIFSTGNENMVFFATNPNMTTTTVASITVNLNAPASKVNLTAAQQTYLEDHTNTMTTKFLSQTMYKVQVNGSEFILFSNQNSVLSNGNKTVTYTASDILAGNTVVGISSASALVNTIEREIENHAGSPFSYNNTTGSLTGRYVSLNFNSTSGVISSFTRVPDNMTIFTSIMAKGNGTIGVSIPSPVYPTAQPIVVGSVFFYGNNTAVYQIHNNPSMLSNFYLSNGTFVFGIANGLNVSIYRPQSYEIEHESLNSSSLNYTGVGLGDQYDVESGSTIVFIHNSTFRGSLFIHGANVTTANGVVTVTANETAHVTFVAPPGLQELKPSVESLVQYAISHGRLAALVVLGSPGSADSNVSVNYNGSMQISVQNVSSGSVTVKVNSMHHEGTNFAIFVPNGVINNNSKITLTFDSQTITLTKTMGSVVNATSTTQASFYYLSVQGGTLVIIHVPHFSSHTIEISTASSTTGGTGLSSLGQYGLYIAVGIVGIIAVIAGVVLTRRKR